MEMSEREQQQEQEQYIPCDVCGGQACAGQGRFVVCNEYCDNVAKRFTEYEARIAQMEAELANERSQVSPYWLRQKTEALREQVRWVPVSERLPEIGARVLSVNEDDFVETKMGRTFVYAPVGMYKYWMPLPLPPMESGQ
jgi:hypothetical protein